MSIRIVIDDQVYALHMLLSRHRKIALDYHRYHSAIFGHYGHVQIDMAPSDGAATRDLLENASNLFVRNLRIIGPGYVGPGYNPLRQRAGGQQSCCGEGA